LQERKVPFNFDFIHAVNLKESLACVDDYKVVVDMSLQVWEVDEQVHTVLFEDGVEWTTQVAVVTPAGLTIISPCWGEGDKVIGELSGLFIELTVAARMNGNRQTMIGGSLCTVSTYARWSLRLCLKILRMPSWEEPTGAENREKRSRSVGDTFPRKRYNRYPMHPRQGTGLLLGVV